MVGNELPTLRGTLAHCHCGPDPHMTIFASSANFCAFVPVPAFEFVFHPAGGPAWLFTNFTWNQSVPVTMTLSEAGAISNRCR